MTKNSPTDAPTLVDLASIWISRIDRGLTPSEEQMLRSWLAENESHAEAFFNLASLWDNLSSLKKFR